MNIDRWLHTPPLHHIHHIHHTHPAHIEMNVIISKISLIVNMPMQKQSFYIF
jgi:hypothetical protein